MESCTHFWQIHKTRCREHITNSVIGISRPPVLDCGTTFHPVCGGWDLPSTASDNLWKIIYFVTEVLTDFWIYRCCLSVCLSIYLSIYLCHLSLAELNVNISDFTDIIQWLYVVFAMTCRWIAGCWSAKVSHEVSAMCSNRWRLTAHRLLASSSDGLCWLHSYNITFVDVQ